MTVLVLEENLMWSVRLAKSLQAFGHEAITFSKPPPDYPQADLAIVNLGSTLWNFEELVPSLQSRGTKILGHAGHKEKQLHELGKNLGCDILATNSELTHKLPQLIDGLAG